MPKAGSITYWYLQVPNLILLGIVALLLIRLLLSLVLPERNPLVRPFAVITHPVTAAVGALTPRIVPRAGVIVCAVVWLLALRTALFMAALAMGVRL